MQLAFYAQITITGLALLVGPFQFSSSIRRRHLKVHRAVGRVYVVSVLLGGTAAFVMSFFSSVAFSGVFGFGTLAVVWVLVTVKAYRAFRRDDVASHQAWMMRSFALTYAAPTLRLWLSPSSSRSCCSACPPRRPAAPPTPRSRSCRGCRSSSSWSS